MFNNSLCDSFGEVVIREVVIAHARENLTLLIFHKGQYQRLVLDLGLHEVHLDFSALNLRGY